MLSFFEPRSNAVLTAKQLVKLLGVKISDSTLKKEIEEHPDYPSLLSIADVLNNYGIENICIKLNNGTFDKIPVPFVTQVRGQNTPAQFFTVVKEINNQKAVFFDPEKFDWKELPSRDFVNRCSGIILLAEVGDQAGEMDYDKKNVAVKQKRVVQSLIASCIPTLVIIAGVAALIQNGIDTLLPFAFSVLTLIGSIIGVLLHWYELDQHNPLLQPLCSSGKKVNCSAILQSKASKIAGISWSSIGMTYFTGMLLLLLFGGLNTPWVLFSVSSINLIAVPYILFSVYYQWRMARQWCILCLAVQAVIALQFTISLIGGWPWLSSLHMVRSGVIVSIFAAFAIPFVVLSIMIPALQKAKERKYIDIELQRLKHNRQIFEALLQKQKKITAPPQNLGLMLGNPDAPYKLITVCNPYCGPCAKAHKPIEDLSNNNRDVCIQIVFTATNAPGDVKALPVKHLLAIAKGGQEQIIKQALDDWYLAERRDYEIFASRFPMNGELEKQADKIDAMEGWCEKVKIEFTPTFFISMPGAGEEGAANFYQLPEMYKIEDLKYMFST